jgi:adenylate cyclase
MTALRRWVTGTAIAAVLVVAAWFPEPDRALLARANGLIMDMGFWTLREWLPRPATLEPVLIGIDDASLAEFVNPLALWHPHFADLFQALAIAKPKAVGVDVVLPERSYDFVLPGGDLTLLRAIAKLRAVAPIVLARRVDSQGRLVGIHPPFIVGAGGQSALGLDQVLLDADLTVRRFDEQALAVGEPIPAFAGQLARAAGLTPAHGWIDYSRGVGVRYVPMQTLVAWFHEGDEAALQKALQGRVVLVGTITHGEDRLAVPVRLAAFDPPTTPAFRPRQPGVLIHLQALRSMGGDGLIRAVPNGFVIVLCGLALWPLAPVIRRRLGGQLRLYALAVLFAVVVLSATLWALYSAWWLPPAFPLAVLLAALTAESIRALRERLKLKASLEGQVSPAVLTDIMRDAANRQATIKRDACVLFSDIRGFTSASEAMPPEAMTALLKRYFDAMVGVVHAQNGVLDKFMGDGMMVLFGVPNTLSDPCERALTCAQDMLKALRVLNEDLQRQGHAPLQIGVGINYGPVVAGWIGSSQRNNYSAIGDTVNVAARVEGLTKDHPFDIIVTESMALQLPPAVRATQLEDLGPQAIKGHTPVRVYGVRPNAPNAQLVP